MTPYEELPDWLKREIDEARRVTRIELALTVAAFIAGVAIVIGAILGAIGFVQWMGW